MDKTDLKAFTITFLIFSIIYLILGIYVEKDFSVWEYGVYNTGLIMSAIHFFICIIVFISYIITSQKQRKSK